MNAQPVSAETAPSPDLETSINQAIEACGGDLRNTIRALVVANGFLEQENRTLQSSVSAGYVRRAYYRSLEQAAKPAAGGPSER